MRIERALLIGILAVWITHVFAQTYRDSGGTIVPAYMPLPPARIPLSPSQHNLAPTTATKLAVPAGARLATICATGATVRYEIDGVTTPTSSVGEPLWANTCTSFSGAALLANFTAISATGTLDIIYMQ